MPRHTLTLCLPLLLALAACSSEDRRAGGTTPDEAKALEDAAQMLDSRQLPSGSVPSGAPQSPAPSASPSATPSG